MSKERSSLHSHQDTYGRNKGDSRCWVDHGDVGVKGAVCDKCVTERNLTAGTCDVEGYGFNLAVAVGDIDADILWLLTCCSIPGDCESCGTWNIPGMSESGTDAGQVTRSYTKCNTTCIFQGYSVNNGKANCMHQHPHPHRHTYTDTPTSSLTQKQQRLIRTIYSFKRTHTQMQAPK